MYSNRKWLAKLMVAVLGVLAVAQIAPAQRGPAISLQRSLAPSPAPDEARDIFNAGQSFYDDDKFPDAERRFREVVNRFPTNPIADKADYYLIRTLTQTGKRSEALTRIGAFAKQYPKSKWLEDVQEMQMRLTNRVPANAEYLLLTQGFPTAAPQPPAAPAAPARAIRARVQVTPPPAPLAASAPPEPPAPPSPFVFVGPGFGAGFGAAIGAGIGAGIGAEFQSSDPQISLQQEIMRAMFRNNFARAIEIATERLKTNPADPVVLSSLNMIAGSNSAQAMPMLLAIVKNSTNPKARRDAIFWLGQSRGDKDSIVDTLVGLIPSLADEDSEAVAYALSQVRTDKSLNALAAIARDKNKSEKSRNNALFWIGQSRAANRVSLLEDIYKGSMDSPKIRQQIMYALNQTRDPRAVTIMGNVASSDPDIEVRKQAVYWLGQSKSPEANQELERLLQKK